MKSVLRRQGGTVTLDWVILTAGVCLFGAAVGEPIYQGVIALLNGTATNLDAVEVPSGWSG